jgi:hypothetical protein
MGLTLPESFETQGIPEAGISAVKLLQTIHNDSIHVSIWDRDRFAAVATGRCVGISAVTATSRSELDRPYCGLARISPSIGAGSSTVWSCPAALSSVEHAS